MGSISGWTLYVLILIGLAFTVIWILLPFAVFGIKTYLKEILKEQQNQNKLLKKLTGENKYKDLFDNQ